MSQGEREARRRVGTHRVCLVAHSHYEEDARLRRQGEALVRSGQQVDAFGLGRPGQERDSVIGGVRLRRLPVDRHQGAGLATYIREYVDFFLRAARAVSAADRGRRYALVQVATPPDPLVFAAVPLKLRGIPLVIDLHEAMPEFFASRFPRAATRPAHALLRLAEAASIRVSDAAITVNEALADRLRSLGVPRAKLSVVLNSPDLSRFDPALHPPRRFMEDGVLRLVYTGALTPIYELDVVLQALARLRLARPALRAELDIYGRGDQQGALATMAASAELGDRVRFHGRLPLDEIPACVARADVGLAPTRRDRFTEMSMSTKLLEYAAMDKPVVASALATVRRYFADDTVATYEPGDADALAAALARLVEQPDERAQRVARTHARVLELSWEREAERYVELVERLIESRRLD